MNAENKVILSQEAEMQIQALKKIASWRTIAIAVSSIGIALLYTGLAGAETSTLLCVLGVIIIAAGLLAGLILNLGIKNGRRNVEKIMAAIESK